MTKAKPLAQEPTHRVVKLDPKQGAGGLRYMGGSQSDDFNYVLADQTMKTAWTGNSRDPSWTAQIHQASADALKGIAPQDEVEGMLAAQMVATHNAVMECYRRSMLPEQPFAGRETALTQANKLTRSYATLVHALDKHRGKGNQTVRVEHVHVYPNAQAIIGNVAPATLTGGAQPQLARATDGPTHLSAPELEAIAAHVAEGGGRDSNDD